MSIKEEEALGKLCLLKLCVFTNKIDAQLLDSVAVSSYIAGVYLASISSGVPMNLGNLYHGLSSTLGIGCKARPSQA
jgi:hypothetical protein